MADLTSVSWLEDRSASGQRNLRRGTSTASTRETAAVQHQQMRVPKAMTEAIVNDELRTRSTRAQRSPAEPSPKRYRRRRCFKYDWLTLEILHTRRIIIIFYLDSTLPLRCSTGKDVCANACAQTWQKRLLEEKKTNPAESDRICRDNKDILLH